MSLGGDDSTLLGRLLESVADVEGVCGSFRAEWIRLHLMPGLKQMKLGLTQMVTWRNGMSADER
jgi:hypothetical protein